MAKAKPDENMERCKKIFRHCFDVLEKYKDGIKETDWPEIAASSKGLDGTDRLAVDIFSAVYRELARQYDVQRKIK